MKSSRASRTAHLVALGRALADAGLSHVANFRDPTAHVFLSDKGRDSLAKTLQQMTSGKRTWSVEMARVMADMMALRTTAIDAGVRDAISRGAKQLVILGAGYDGRAWRLADLTGIRVFEVDHPATQAEKRARLSELPEPAAAVAFVPIDFERESIEAALARAGHDASLPTCWIWEGVVMYLTRDAMRATLAAIARRSAAGSTLIVNYHSARGNLFGRIMLKLIGEPQISMWTPSQIADEFRAVGYDVREDTGAADWNRAFAEGAANVNRAFYMRVAIAVRTKQPTEK